MSEISTKPTAGKLSAFSGPNAKQNAYNCGQWLRSTLAGRGFNATATEGTDSAGGYTVPSEMSSAIIDTRTAVGVSRQVSRVEAMGSDVKNVPKLVSGPAVKYPGEATAIVASDEVWGTVTLTAVKRAVMCKVSNELNDDSIIDIMDQLAGRIGYQLALQEDNELVNGDGTSTYGSEEGLLDQLGAAGKLTLPSGDDTWGEIVLTDFTDLMGILPSKYNQGTAFICSNAFYHTVMVKLLAAAGGNTMMALEAGASRPTFLGKPVYLTDQMPTATGVSTTSVLYGNFKEACIIGDRIAIELFVSPHRYMEEDVLAVRAVSRYDINVHEPGDGSNAGAYVGMVTAAS